ncbi:MAG: inositol monophosphatase family protein [Desulfobacterales bacterium]|jgi:myo-inositol-1(or 4)-monophosphatase
MDLEHAKRVGIAAAYAGAQVLRDQFGNISQINKKGAFDLLTEADTGSEKKIIATIREAFPDHTILAEESGSSEGAGEYRWLIDPLDGTTNFAHQLPIFAISIALATRRNIVLGLVLDPMDGELFSAISGKGAELNGSPIKVSSSASVCDSLLVTGFPYDFNKIVEPAMRRFTVCQQASQGVRRLGAAALDICYVACGRFDGFWEQNLKPWDKAAGAIIAQEAGAVITNFSNRPFSINQKEILVTNGRIHQEMLSLLAIEGENLIPK